MLELDNLRQDVAPSAPNDFWISHRQVGTGNLAVDQRLLLRLVFRVEQSPDCRFVSSFQALASAGVLIKQVEHAALAAIDAVVNLVAMLAAFPSA
jgi:hypothetical protein